MTRYLRYAFISALVIGVAFLGFLANQARIEIRLFQEEPLDNIYWNLTQLELDLVRFQSAVELSLALSDYPKDELLKRFDLFYSRINNFSSSSTLAGFELTQTVAPTITRLRSFLEVTTPVIDGDPDRLVQSLPNLATELESLRKDLRVRSSRSSTSTQQRRTSPCRAVQPDFRSCRRDAGSLRPARHPAWVGPVPEPPRRTGS
jgi:hypothetical protein